MPIYEYICQDCNEKYDKFVRSRPAEVKLECPRCGSEQAKKAFSAFSTRGGSSSSRPLGGPPPCGPVG